MSSVAIYNRFIYFGRNSVIHGLNHLFRYNSNLLSRLFWILILVSSAFGLYLLLLLVAEDNTTIGYRPETRYLEWNTNFPATTVCETYNAKQTMKNLAEKYPTLMDPLTFEQRRYISDLVFAGGTCSRATCVPCGDKVPCDVPWRQIVDDIHKTCEELISDCYFNNKEFSCCKKFLPVDSERGTCYGFNSLQNKDATVDILYYVNKSSGPGVLKFRLLSDSEIAVHSNEELTTNNLDAKFKFEVRTSRENAIDFLFSQVEMENDPLLGWTDPQVKGCRYLNEVPLGSNFHRYLVYSYGACQLAQRTEHFYEQCGCVHPARDSTYQEKYCNYTGLNCIVTHEALSKLGAENVAAKVCLPSCMETELTTIHMSRRWDPLVSGPGSVVRVRMAALPTLRYQRDLLGERLDLVVSVGGIVGLFFSASILSLVEAFYLFLRKPNY